MAELKTLEQYQEARRAVYERTDPDVFTPEDDSRRPTGIACPHCQTELVYADDSIKLSYPPQRVVTCPHCSHSALVWA